MPLPTLRRTEELLWFAKPHPLSLLKRLLPFFLLTWLAVGVLAVGATGPVSSALLLVGVLGALAWLWAVLVSWSRTVLVITTERAFYHEAWLFRTKEVESLLPNILKVDALVSGAGAVLGGYGDVRIDTGSNEQIVARNLQKPFEVKDLLQAAVSDSVYSE